MKKMRRSVAAMMSGILALSPASAIFADEAAEAPVTYGNLISFSLTQGGEALTADITSVYNESGDASISVSVALPASMMGTEEPVEYGFDDVLRVCGDEVYLNVDEVVSLYQDLTGDDSITDVLSMVGITESWLAIPTTPSNGTSESDDAVINALTDSLTSLEAVTTDTGVQIAINNDAILAIAQNVDAAMASTEGTDASAEEDLESMALVYDYILAAAEGFRAADPSLSEEDSLALVSDVLDAMFSNVEEEAGVETDASADLSVTDLVSAVLETVSFDGVLSIDSADGVDAVLLDLQATENGEEAFGLQVGMGSITEGEFTEFSAPESFVSLRDVVTNVASLYYTSIASGEEASEEVSSEAAE